MNTIIASMCFAGLIVLFLSTKEPPPPQPVEYQFIEYTVDSCYSDDIGLKKLTIEDIEDLIK